MRGFWGGDLHWWGLASFVGLIWVFGCSGVNFFLRWDILDKENFDTENVLLLARVALFELLDVSMNLYCVISEETI